MKLKTNNFRPSTEMGKRSFTYLAPRCWNGLPGNLRIIPELVTFKASLKTFLFENFVDYVHRCFPYTMERISYSQPLENQALISIVNDIDDDEYDFA